jgi:hypothetical protein
MLCGELGTQAGLRQYGPWRVLLLVMVVLLWC